jgi:hypothetical protein
MSTFLHLLSESDTAENMKTACSHLVCGKNDPGNFAVVSESFNSVSSEPFAYWLGESVRRVFNQLPVFGGIDRTTKHGFAIAHGLAALFVKPMKTSEGATK